MTTQREHQTAQRVSNHVRREIVTTRIEYAVTMEDGWNVNHAQLGAALEAARNEYLNVVKRPFSDDAIKVAVGEGELVVFFVTETRT